VLAAEDVLELFEEEVFEAVVFEYGVDVVLVKELEEVKVVVLPVPEGVKSATVALAADVVDAVTVLVLPDMVLPDTVMAEAEAEDVELEMALLDELEEVSEPPVRWKGNDS
jgi:D-ribose pyranose/furanose isomerase RbsD